MTVGMQRMTTCIGNHASRTFVAFVLKWGTLPTNLLKVPFLTYFQQI